MPTDGVLAGVAGVVPFFSGRGERGGPDMPLSSIFLACIFLRDHSHNVLQPRSTNNHELYDHGRWSQDGLVTPGIEWGEDIELQSGSQRRCYSLGRPSSFPGF